MKQNENEYVVIKPDDVKNENWLPKIKLLCMKALESQYFETLSMVLISLYTVFIIFWLTLADLMPFISDSILSNVDTSFLACFLAEIIVKTFASNFWFLIDKFNLFDAIIVIISFALNMSGIIAKGLGVLRLVRVVVITIWKITGNTNKLRHQSKEADPLKSVLTILTQLGEIKEISESIWKESKWA